MAQQAPASLPEVDLRGGQRAVHGSPRRVATNQPTVRLRIPIRKGLEETPTLHHLGFFEELGRSLKTTKAIPNGSIENLMGEVEDHIENVKHWHHSPQRHQWLLLALLESETSFRRLSGYRDLPDLNDALKEAIPDRE